MGEGRSLVVVHSKERLVGGRGSGYPVLADEDELEAKIRDQIEQARKEGISATCQLVTGVAGHAAHMIADAAREAGADVIVVGTMRARTRAVLLLGSVTQRLLHIAPCPFSWFRPPLQPEVGEKQFKPNSRDEGRS